MDQRDSGIRRISGRIMSSPSIPEQSKRAVEEHIEFLRAREARPGTMEKHLYALEKFLGVLGPVPAQSATKEQLEAAMVGLSALPVSGMTKASVRTVVKQFYKHLSGDDVAYPREVAWIRSTGPRALRKLPQDLVSEEEVERMLESTSNFRDRAIIALLYDAGIRAGELLGMRKKDVDLMSEPPHIVVDGKTGMRRVPILFSVPYIAQYLDMMKGLGQSDPMWIDVGVKVFRKKPVNRSGVTTMLKRTAARAGIRKRIYPHLFRHSRASYYANRLTEQQLKSFFGWTGDSRMASVYVHLSGRDIDNAILVANGMKPLPSETGPKLKARDCLRCRTSNAIDAVYCQKCGTPMDFDYFGVLDHSDNKAEVATKL